MYACILKMEEIILFYHYKKLRFPILVLAFILSILIEASFSYANVMGQNKFICCMFI